MTGRPLSYLLNIIALGALTLAVYAIVFLSPALGTTVARIAGVAMVICTVARQRIVPSDRNASAEKARFTIVDILSFSAVGTALALGYLIYGANDTLAGRKLYVAVFAALTVGFMLASNLVAKVARRQAS